MKFMDAQKRPERAFVRVSQRANALVPLVQGSLPWIEIILVLVVGFYPSPQLHTSPPFSCSVPWPLAPALGVPSTNTKPQVKLFGVRMLQDLSQRSREISEVLLLECRLGLVTGEVERREKGALRERSDKETLVVASARDNTCYGGIEQQEIERREHFSIAPLSH
jgi:hypothetical protein